MQKRSELTNDSIVSEHKSSSNLIWRLQVINFFLKNIPKKTLNILTRLECIMAQAENRWGRSSVVKVLLHVFGQEGNAEVIPSTNYQRFFSKFDEVLY